MDLDRRDTTDLTPDEALDASRLVQSTLRPQLLDRLLELYRQGAAGRKGVDTEITEVESRVRELDEYGLRLDQLIVNERPPLPAQLCDPKLTVLRRDGREYVAADAEMFFSAESLTNVHGPVMLYHLATLADHLLCPGESIVGIRKTAFRQLVVHQMRLYVCEASQALPQEAATRLDDAAVTGTFVLSSGRRLTFFGVQLPGRSVKTFASQNSFALNLLPRDMAWESVAELYRVQLATRVPDEVVPAGGFTPAASLMSALDVMLLMLLHLPYPEPTRLLLRVAELDIPFDPVAQLAGGCLEVRSAKERLMNSGMRFIRAGYRFSPLEGRFRSIQIGLSDAPYYRFVVR